MGDVHPSQDLTSPETLGETSKAGLRRMRQLSSSPSELLSPSRAIIHPTTGTLIYPAPIPLTGHLIAPIFPVSSSRPLPTPSVFGPSELISSSHDGLWITIYHSSPTIPGGTLVIYPSSILSPLTTSTSIVPLSTLSLPSSPLAMTHLYPPRTHLAGSTLARALGPPPPPSYDPTTGPALVILTSSSLLLIHPAAMPQGNVSTMNMIKANLTSRSHVVMGDLTGSDNAGSGAVKGWMGLVPNDHGVWVATQDKDLKVLRAEIGVDARGRWYLQTVPLPLLPRMVPPVTSNEEVTSSTVQGVGFIPLSPDMSDRTQPEDSEAITPNGARVAVVFQDHLASGLPRTRIQVCGIARKEIEIVESFGEISGSSDMVKSWDWSVEPDITTSLSPPGIIITSLAQLPAVPSHAAAVALICSAKGISLSRLDIASNHSNGDQLVAWSALQGEEVALKGVALQDATILPSQGLGRDGLGLTAVFHEDGVLLVPGPTSSSKRQDSEYTNNPTDKVAAPDDPLDTLTAANTIIQAIKQSADWSDIPRILAASGTDAPQKDHVDLLKAAWALLRADNELDELLELLKLQIAFLEHDHSKRDLAAELLRLAEASRLFSASASTKDGQLQFDLSCVSSLVDVAEWAHATLGVIMRDLVNERAKYDWYGHQAPEVPPPPRTLYAIQPQIRQIVLRLLAQLLAFSNFVADLNRPIFAPDPKFGPSVIRDARATALAKDRIAGLRLKEGVDLIDWGKALQRLHQSGIADTKPSEEAYTKALVSLDSAGLVDLIRPTLEALPNPSSLFLGESAEYKTYDAITFTLMPSTVGVKCGRCQWRTASLGSYQSGLVGGLGGNGVGDSAWSAWRRAREDGCGCGGRWTRA